MNLQVSHRLEPVKLDAGKRRAALSIDGRRAASFAVRRVDVLTRSRAEALGDEAHDAAGPVLVVFERSSPDARALLREHRVSYAADDGEMFVFAPPIYVERPPRCQPIAPAPAAAAPFAFRASRVPRWLLLHAGERPSFRQLSRELELSESMVSRTVRALADDGLVAIETDPTDARLRLARLRDPARLLDAFERAVAPRRPRRMTWDVGARDAAAAIQAVRDAAVRLKVPYAVGGVAGASLIRRVVEPAEVVIWIGRDDADLWADELMATPSRQAPGRITAQLAPDPFVLSLATNREGIQVADPVQLYLDCRAAGERALEAADAIRTEMRW
jgi:DNA-binding MarR family transcriptional regulator